MAVTRSEFPPWLTMQTKAKKSICRGNWKNIFSAKVFVYHIVTKYNTGGRVPSIVRDNPKILSTDWHSHLHRILTEVLFSKKLPIPKDTRIGHKVHRHRHANYSRPEWSFTPLIDMAPRSHRNASRSLTRRRCGICQALFHWLGPLWGARVPPQPWF